MKTINSYTTVDSWTCLEESEPPWLTTGRWTQGNRRDHNCPSNPSRCLLSFVSSVSRLPVNNMMFWTVIACIFANATRDAPYQTMGVGRGPDASNICSHRSNGSITRRGNTRSFSRVCMCVLCRWFKCICTCWLFCISFVLVGFLDSFPQ